VCYGPFFLPCTYHILRSGSLQPSALVHFVDKAICITDLFNDGERMVPPPAQKASQSLSTEERRVPVIMG